MSDDLNERLRSLPSVDRVLSSLEGLAPQALTSHAARLAVDHARVDIKAGGDAPSLDKVVGRARELLDERSEKYLQTVINATGVLIHTNLGRVPLGERQMDAISRIAGGYSNLEYDLTAGSRGSRYSHASDSSPGSNGGRGRARR